MKITITKERLEELEDKEAKLQALEVGGVDNWEFYGDALEEYTKNIETRKARAKLKETAIKLAEEIDLLIINNQYEPSEMGAGTATREETLEDIVEMLIDFKLCEEQK